MTGEFLVCEIEPKVDCSSYFLYVLCMIFHNSCHLYMDAYTVHISLLKNYGRNTNLVLQ